MKTLAERLAFMLQALGWTQDQLATKVGCSQTAINKILSGKSQTSKLTPTIAQAMGISSDWLALGIGANPSIPNTSDGAALAGHVPCISWIQAGNWGEVVDNFQPGDADLWIETTIPIRRHTYALKVQGDSMEPLFPAGSHIIVEPEMEWENGDYVVIRQNSNTECTFKQIVREGSQLFLKPLNLRYPIIEMRPDAVVCGVVRSMEQRFR